MSLFTDLKNVLMPYAQRIKAIDAQVGYVTNHPVKSAEQLISDKRTTDKVPYKYRASQSGKSDRAYDTIVGGTVCFNQLIVNGDFSDGINGWVTNSANFGTLSLSDNICTFTGGSDLNNSVYIQRQIKLKSEHVFLGVAEINPSRDTNCRFMYSSVADGCVAKTLTANGWGMFASIIKMKAGNTSNNANLYINTSNALQEGDTVLLKNVMVFDLTQMFGSAIADHIYSLEQATAGAGVALFRQMFPNDYYAYNAGELISVEGLSAHVMRDADDNIIGSYPLDNSLTLRGVPKLVDGKIEFDGDTYEADGTVTRRYGVVDLGTLTWGYQAAEGTRKAGFYVDERLPNAVLDTPLGTVGKILCAIYKTVSYGEAYSTNYDTDKAISIRTNGGLRVVDSAYSNAVAFKTAMSGVYLVYELATTTTEEATPYTNPQVVSSYGTEEYVSTSICPVGHVTEYPDNLRAKLDGLPWDLSMIAPVETSYTATRNYTAGQLLIVDNTLYRVTANIANGGTITPNTNVLATTLSEVIASLS